MADVMQHGISPDVRALMVYQTSKKSGVLSYVLWFFLGGFGAHRFYNGRSGTAVVILLLNLVGWVLLSAGFPFVLLFVGIWVLFDAFCIPGWVKEHNTQLMGRLDNAAQRSRG